MKFLRLYVPTYHKIVKTLHIIKEFSCLHIHQALEDVSADG